MSILSRLGRRPFGFGARLALLLALPLALSACGVNVIPTKRIAAQTAWAEVQNQYQRRADLIPNLVSTVQGAAANERGTLTEVIKARASATQVKVDASTVTDPAKFQQFQAAQDNLSGALGRLLVVTENYPNLRTNENFMALQSQLEGTENRVTIARRDYNASVQVYNTEIGTFPGVLWKSILYHGDKPMQLFQAAADAQSAPKVNFNIGAPGMGGTPITGGSTPPGAAPGSPPPSSAPAAPAQ